MRVWAPHFEVSANHNFLLTESLNLQRWGIAQVLLSSPRYYATPNATERLREAFRQSIAAGCLEAVVALERGIKHVFFHLPVAVQHDHVHLVAHFLSKFSVDCVDTTRLAMMAFECGSSQCLAYVLDQYPALDHTTVQTFAPQAQGVFDRRGFLQAVAAHQQRAVLTHELGGVSPPRSLRKI